MTKTANAKKNVRTAGAKAAAMILAIIMVIMMVPANAFADSSETETNNWSAYTLYNYISIDNGRSYISLNTQENGIRTGKTAEEYLRANGNKQYNLQAGEYEIDGYDLTGLVINQNGFRFVEQSVAEEGQPYFVATLDRVEAVKLARFRASSIIEPQTEVFTSLENGEITFHRNWYITLVTPMVPQKVLTGVRLGDGKNGNGNGLYYGIDYTETAQVVDSRYIPFEAKLNSAQYDMEDYDFTDLVLSYNGESYAYRPDGPVAGDGEQFHYYTISFLKMDKLAKSTYGGGTLKAGWPAWPLIKNVKEAGPDGAPYKAGYYHRDYQATLHVADAPAAEIIEEPVDEIIEETNEAETIAAAAEVEEVIEKTTEEPVEEIAEETAEEVTETEEVAEETAEEVTKTEEAVEETAEEVTETEEAVEETTEIEETAEATVEETATEESAEETIEETAKVEETVEASTEIEETIEETAKVEETVEANTEIEETAEETPAVEETAEEIAEEVVEETAEVQAPAAAPQAAANTETAPAAAPKATAAAETQAPAVTTEAQNNDAEIAPAVQPQIEEIAEEEVPLAAAPQGTWSVMNMAAMILTALVALGMVASRTAGLIGTIPAISSVAVFAGNDKLNGSMTMANSQTPVMIALLLAAVILAVVIAKKANK